jgi:hypothetical protein
MATAAALILQRLTVQDNGSQNVDILVNNTVPNYFVWTANGVRYGITPSQTDAQVQTILTNNVTQLLAEISANNELPLNADQLAQYQDVIDAHNLQVNIDALQANNTKFKVGGTVTGDPNVQAGQGYKDVFDKQTGTFTAMANAAKFAVLGSAMFSVLDALIEVNKAVILLCRIAKRQSTTSSFKQG